MTDVALNPSASAHESLEPLSMDPQPLLQDRPHRLHPVSVPIGR
jgi:hypothetical protein